MLSVITGVQAVKASGEIEEAVAIFNPLKAAKDQFMKDLKAAGYLASFASANFACPHCGAKYSKDGNCIVCDVPLLPNDVG